MTKRIIITGGTGMIGSALAAQLVDDYEVIVLSRNPANYQGTLPSGVKVVAWDAASADGWGELADGAHAIVNLAGANIAGGRWTKARKEAILSSRLNAGKAVVAAVAAAQQKPAVVVQASAIGYYGPRASEVITENGGAGDDFPAEVSQQWEPSTAAVDDMGVRHVVIRIGIVLSTEGGALPQLLLPFKFFAGGRLGSGEQWVSWVHILDVVRAIRFLIEDEDARGVFNLTAPAPVTNEVLVNKIGTVLNRPTLVPAPAFALKLALGEMSTIVLDGQRVIPQHLSKEGFAFRYADAETALRDLLLN